MAAVGNMDGNTGSGLHFPERRLRCLNNHITALDDRLRPDLTDIVRRTLSE